MRPARIAAIAACGAAGLLTLLALYETGRVLRARALAPGLIAAALKQADPEILAVPPRRIAMLLAVEDPTFWRNDGIDFSTPGAGMTTLTQGLGKQIYFPEGFRPGFRKIELMLTAKFATTALASKADILHAAMGRYNFGRDNAGDITGFTEAARRYFGRPLSALTDDEYLSLVAMLRAPSLTDPVRHPAANRERVRRIKRLLAGQCTPKGVRDDALNGCAA